MAKDRSPTIAVIGLGYVGLPLALALARHYDVIGFDISSTRIHELQKGNDRTHEVSDSALLESAMKLTSDVAGIVGANVFIITVPTPIDGDNEPDLGPVMSACAIVGPALKQGAIAVFESTVYPGVTENLCGSALEKSSGLRCGIDFFLGYSPERINPGDRQHTVDKIAKVVAGQTPAVTDLLAEIYGRVTSGGIFKAASIKVGLD